MILNQLFTVVRVEGISSYRPEVSSHLPPAHGAVRAVDAPLNSFGVAIHRGQECESLVARMDLNHRSLGGNCHDQAMYLQPGYEIIGCSRTAMLPAKFWKPPLAKGDSRERRSNRQCIEARPKRFLAPFMIHEDLPTLTETAFGSHPCNFRGNQFGDWGTNPPATLEPTREAKRLA